jgi:hypothetical protein
MARCAASCTAATTKTVKGRLWRLRGALELRVQAGTELGFETG